jgi:hypothetical protein
MDRRDFLTASLMTVAAFKAAVPAAAAPATAPMPVPARVDLSQARFRALIGTHFHLTTAGWRGDVRLDEVRPGPERAGLEQFTTVFIPEGSPAPAPGLYEVSHPEAGRFALRIEGLDPDGRRAATFALLRA